MKEVNQLDLQQFNFADLYCKFGFYLLLGRRNTGKTTWCRYINRFLRTTEEGVVIVVVDNVKIKYQWSEFVPITHIYTAAEFDALEYVQQVQNSVHHSLQRHALNADGSLQYKLGVTIILDDLGAHPKIMNSRILKNLAATGRHIHTNIFLLLQHLKQAPPPVRNQFQMVFMLQCSNHETLKTIHREYVSMVDFRDFRDVLHSTTQNFGLLVINCDSKASHTIQDVCYFAEMDEAEVDKVVPLGKSTQWSFSEENYLENNQYVDLLDDKFAGGDTLKIDFPTPPTVVSVKPGSVPRLRINKVYSGVL